MAADVVLFTFFLVFAFAPTSCMHTHTRKTLLMRVYHRAMVKMIVLVDRQTNLECKFVRTAWRVP